MKTKRNQWIGIIALLLGLMATTCSEGTSDGPPPVSPKPSGHLPTGAFTHRPAQTTKKEDSPKKQPVHNIPIQYTDSDRLHLLDSLHRISASHLDDSIDYTGMPPAMPYVHRVLSPKQFKTLQRSCGQGVLDSSLVTILVPKDALFGEPETLLKADSIEIVLHSFPGESKFDYYAVELLSGYGQVSTVAYFHGNTLVASQDVYHWQGLNLYGYTDGAGRRFVAYETNIAHGLGVREMRINFYCWREDRLVPALQLLGFGSWAYGPRSYWLGAKLIPGDTLRINFLGHQSLRQEMIDGDEIEITQFDTTVPFDFDTVSQRYVGNWKGTGFSRAEMLTFTTCENDPLFVHTHYHLLKRLLQGKSQAKREAVAAYLDMMLAGDYPKGTNAKR